MNLVFLFIYVSTVTYWLYVAFTQPRAVNEHKIYTLDLATAKRRTMDSLSPSGHGYMVEPPRTGTQAGSSVLGGFLFLVLSLCFLFVVPCSTLS